MLIFLICIALLVLFVLACWLMLQTSVLRHPMPDLSDPRVLAVTRYKSYAAQIRDCLAWLKIHEPEKLYVQSFDGLSLHARLVLHPQARGTVLLMHGYRSSYAIDFSCALPFYFDQGFNLLICDQRAHGDSQGRIISFGVKERHDVVTWADLLARKLGRQHPVFLAGLSMGAASVTMASSLTYAGNIRGIIADCGFTTPRAIISHVAKNRMHLPAKPLMPVLAWLTKTFCGFSLDGCAAPGELAKTALPVVFIHGTADRFVPPEMSRENFAACRKNARLLEVDGAEHGMSYLVNREAYESLIAEFLETNLQN